MNLYDCLRQASEALFQEGEQTAKVDDIIDRALEINGARSEFEQQAHMRMRQSLRRDAKRILREATETALEEIHPEQASLFSLLPGPPAPRAVALPSEDGDYTYKAFEATTDADLAAHDRVQEENILRAQAARDDAQKKRRFLARFRTTPETTTIEALANAARMEKGAA